MTPDDSTVPPNLQNLTHLCFSLHTYSHPAQPSYVRHTHMQTNPSTLLPFLTHLRIPPPAFPNNHTCSLKHFTCSSTHTHPHLIIIFTLLPSYSPLTQPPFHTPRGYFTVFFSFVWFLPSHTCQWSLYP